MIWFHTSASRGASSPPLTGPQWVIWLEYGSRHLKKFSLPPSPRSMKFRTFDFPTHPPTHPNGR